jgi:hypothetical protein
MSMAQVVGFDEESIEKHFNYQEVEVWQPSKFLVR